MRTIIGSIFTAIFVAEVTNKLPEKLTSLVVPAVIDAGLPSSSVSALLTAVGAGSQDALLAVPGMSQEILSITNAKVSDAYAAAYAYPAYTAVALGVTSIVAAYFIRDFDHCLSDHVSRQIYHKSETKKDILQESQNSLGEETQVHEGTKTSNPDPEKTVEA